MGRSLRRTVPNPGPEPGPAAPRWIHATSLGLLLDPSLDKSGREPNFHGAQRKHLGWLQNAENLAQRIPLPSAFQPGSPISKEEPQSPALLSSPGTGMRHRHPRREATGREKTGNGKKPNLSKTHRSSPLLSEGGESREPNPAASRDSSGRRLRARSHRSVPRGSVPPPGDSGATALPNPVLPGSPARPSGLGLGIPELRRSHGIPSGTPGAGTGRCWDNARPLFPVPPDVSRVFP